jgi:hypothetical protein
MLGRFAAKLAISANLIAARAPLHVCLNSDTEKVN